MTLVRTKAATALRKETNPVDATVKLIGRPGHLMVLHALMDNPCGFHELMSAVGSVRAKVLSDCLSDLQDQGLVDREVCDRSPLRVRYVLTDKGAELETMFHAMRAWGEKWIVR